MKKWQSSGFVALTDRPDIACYVINLARDRARLDVIASSLSQAGIAYARHSAVDGKRHSRLIHRVFRQRFFSAAKARELTDGEIGCALSHMSACRRMLREGAQKALILEDDAVFAPEFAAFYHDHLGALLDRFDIVKMEGIYYDYTSRDAVTLAESGATKLVLPLRPTLGAAAYAVTRRGAQRLLKSLVKIDDPLDVRLIQYERHRARFAELRPMLVHQSAAPSSLETDRVLAEEHAVASPVSFVTRIARILRYVRRGAGRMCLWLLWTGESFLRGRQIGGSPDRGN